MSVDPLEPSGVLQVREGVSVDPLEPPGVLRVRESASVYPPEPRGREGASVYPLEQRGREGVAVDLLKLPGGPRIGPREEKESSQSNPIRASNVNPPIHHILQATMDQWMKNHLPRNLVCH